MSQGLFFHNIASLRPVAQCFPVNFAKFLRAPFVYFLFFVLNWSFSFIFFFCIQSITEVATAGVL